MRCAAISASVGNGVVEVVTAEDIGKMPDKNVADAIQRRVVPHLATVDAALGQRSDVSNADLDRLIAETECALEELREVCRGVFPALLERRGLVPALTGYLSAASAAAAPGECSLAIRASVGTGTRWRTASSAVTPLAVASSFSTPEATKR